MCVCARFDSVISQLWKFCLLTWFFNSCTVYPVIASSRSMRGQWEMLPSSTGVAVGQYYFIKMSYSYTFQSHIEFLFYFCTIDYFIVLFLLICWASTASRASSEKTAQVKWKSSGLKMTEFTNTWRLKCYYIRKNIIAYKRSTIQQIIGILRSTTFKISVISRRFVLLSWW